MWLEGDGRVLNNDVIMMVLLIVDWVFCIIVILFFVLIGIVKLE